MRHCPPPEDGFSFDLHVLGMPPAFVLSQDQTLRLNTTTSITQTNKNQPKQPRQRPTEPVPHITMTSTHQPKPTDQHHHKLYVHETNSSRNQNQFRKHARIRKTDCNVYEQTKNNTNAARASLPIYPLCQRASWRLDASPGASRRRDAVYTSASPTVSNPL